VKHLKPFNESKENLKDELQDLCDNSLAYLYDEGYTISLSVRDKVKYPGKNHIVVSLGLPEENHVPTTYGNGYQKFNWQDVKDYYIPFLRLLVRRYELQSYLDDTVYVYLPNYTNTCVYLQFNTISGFRYCSLDAVINDRTNLPENWPLWGINIKVVDKI
jgi:hypothetical protein